MKIEQFRPERKKIELDKCEREQRMKHEAATLELIKYCWINRLDHPPVHKFGRDRPSQDVSVTSITENAYHCDQKVSHIKQMSQYMIALLCLQFLLPVPCVYWKVVLDNSVVE